MTDLFSALDLSFEHRLIYQLSSPLSAPVVHGHPHPAPQQTSCIIHQPPSSAHPEQLRISQAVKLGSPCSCAFTGSPNSSTGISQVVRG